MCQNSMPPGSFGSDDYSLQTAVTGAVRISTANPNLDGTGSLGTVITAPTDNGIIVKSIIIKAITPVTTGMIRLFIQSAGGAFALYKEVPVIITPQLNATPMPFPVLPMFELKLDADLKLNPGFKLAASTQNGQAFNVIAEAIDWKYQTIDPLIVCCNFRQDKADTGIGTVSTANANLDGASGTRVTVFTSPGSINGSYIRAITIKALQSTNEGMIRFFLTPNASATNYLMKEVYVPETTQSGFEPSWKIVLDECYYIATGTIISASTQLGQSFAITVEAIDWTYPVS